MIVIKSSTGEKFRTSYNGDDSKSYGPIEIHGTPRTSSHEEWENIIKSQVTREYYKDRQSWPLIPKDEECFFYMLFLLPESEYRSGTDVDNLLKPAIDAIKKTQLIIKDDISVKGIKVFKEPVKKCAGLSFKWINTKAFKIKKVRIVNGNKFMPHWNSQIQYIETNLGTFIDNLEGRIFIARTDKEEQQYHDVVPGYDWKSKEGQKVSGCMVFKRTHTHEKMSKTFHWLHKWAWW